MNLESLAYRELSEGMTEKELAPLPLVKMDLPMARCSDRSNRSARSVCSIRRTGGMRTFH